MGRFGIRRTGGGAVHAFSAPAPGPPGAPDPGVPDGPVLVTGAAGFIGSALVKALITVGRPVVAIDRDERRLRDLVRRVPSPQFRHQVIDVTAAEAIADVAAATRPAAVVHLAARHMIAQCEQGPRETVDVNIGGLINTLAAAGRAGAGFFLFASTADVYAPGRAPHAESNPTRPSTVYGTTKLLGERLVAEWAAGVPGRRATSMRIFNVYGPGDQNPHVIPDLLRGLRSGGVIRMGNVESRRDFIHVDDLAELMCGVLDSSAPPGQVNAGTGTATSVAELIQLIGMTLGRPVHWTSETSRRRPEDRPHLEADPARARSLFPAFDPRPLAAGLAELLASIDPRVRPSVRAEPELTPDAGIA